MTLADQLRLMVITDPVLLRERDAVEVCRQATAGGGGATMIQVRWKDGTPREMLQLARALVLALPVPVLVNDRVDVALAAGAAGAHLGHGDPPLDALRPEVPPGFLLGISVGSVAEAERVRAWPADYWSVGPCFATGNKADAGGALGAAGFATLARHAPEGMPVIGIGGITAGNASAIIRAGAVGVAVIGAVLGAPDPREAVRALRAALSDGGGSPSPA
jgi:thiamine-phosphate pyrophosphorylase